MHAYCVCVCLTISTTVTLCPIALTPSSSTHLYLYLIAYSLPLSCCSTSWWSSPAPYSSRWEHEFIFCFCWWSCCFPRKGCHTSLTTCWSPFPCSFTDFVLCYFRILYFWVCYIVCHTISKACSFLLLLCYTFYSNSPSTLSNHFICFRTPLTHYPSTLSSCSTMHSLSGAFLSHSSHPQCCSLSKSTSVLGSSRCVLHSAYSPTIVFKFCYLTAYSWHLTPLFYCLFPLVYDCSMFHLCGMLSPFLHRNRTLHSPLLSSITIFCSLKL